MPDEEQPTQIKFDNCRIRSDGTHQWILEDRNVADGGGDRDPGEIFWSNRRNYPSLKMALEQACNQRLLTDTEYNTVQQLLSEIKSLELTIDRVAAGFVLDNIDPEDAQDLLLVFSRILKRADIKNRKIQDEPVLEAELGDETITFTVT